MRTVGREGAHDVGDYGPHMEPSDKSCSDKHWVSCMSTHASQVEIERENIPDADKLCLPISQLRFKKFSLMYLLAKEERRGGEEGRTVGRERAHDVLVGKRGNNLSKMAKTKAKSEVEAFN